MFQIKEKIGFWKSVIYGGFWVNIVKIILSGAIAIGVLIIIAISTEKLSELRKRRIAMKTIQTYGKYKNFEGIKIKYPECFEESIKYFDLLSVEQLKFLKEKVLSPNDYGDKEILLLISKDFTSDDRDYLSGFPDIDRFYSILRYKSLHQVNLVTDIIYKEKANMQSKKDVLKTDA